MAGFLRAKSAMNSAPHFALRTGLVGSAGAARGFSASMLSARQETDDETLKKIYPNTLPFFADNGMFIVRPQAATFKEDNGKLIASREGNLWFTFYRRSDATLKYDTSTGIRCKVRAMQLGTILDLDPRALAKPDALPVSIPFYQGSLTFGPAPAAQDGDCAEDTTNEATTFDEPKLLVTAKSNAFEAGASPPEPINVEITTGQLRTFQALLHHVAPSFWGWQTLTDPRSARFFMDKPAAEERTSADTFFN